MKKVLLLTAAVLALSAPVASAQTGINLHWNDCFAGGGLGNLNDACTSTFGAPYTLVTSVIPPDVPTFVGAEMVLDLQVDAPSLPDWWRYDAAGCRAGRMTASFDFTIGPFNCLDPWGGQAFGGLDYSLKANPAQARIKVAAAVAPPGIHLDPLIFPEHYMAKVSILKTLSTSCAGCLTPACIVFNSILLAQPAGVGNFFISNAANSQHVTWQGGGALETACPGVTPNQSNSWGEIKAMYR